MTCAVLQRETEQILIGNLIDPEEFEDCGWVYVIQSEMEPSLYKVGRSARGNLDERLKQLKEGDKTKLVKTALLQDYKWHEKEIHKSYKDCRLPQSEWFKLDDKRIDYILRILSLNDLSNTQVLSGACTLGPLYITKEDHGIILKDEDGECVALDTEHIPIIVSKLLEIYQNKDN